MRIFDVYRSKQLTEITSGQSYRLIGAKNWTDKQVEKLLPLRPIVHFNYFGARSHSGAHLWRDQESIFTRSEDIGISLNTLTDHIIHRTSDNENETIISSPDNND
jgi:hypothetical protein